MLRGLGVDYTMDLTDIDDLPSDELREGIQQLRPLGLLSEDSL